MKKLLLTISFVMLVFFGIAQVTNVGVFRAVDATTPFEKNLPTEMTIIDEATNIKYLVILPCADTHTITTALAANVIQIDAGAADQDLSYTASPTDGTVEITDGTNATIPLADATNAGLLTAVEKQKIADALTNPVDVLEMNTSYSPTDLEPQGSMYWDDEARTFTIVLGNGVKLQVGLEGLIPVHNATGAVIENGKICGGVGISSGVISIEKGNNNSRYTALVVTTEEIADGQSGLAVEIEGQYTANTGSLSVGPIWLGTDGDPTNTQPAFDSYVYPCGAVLSTGTEGRIQFLSAGVNYRNDIANILNGAIREPFDFKITSNGTTITGSLEKKGGGDLTVMFSDGWVDLDCTPARTITLSAGTDADRQTQYIYIDKTTNDFAVSNDYWIDTEHAPVAYAELQSATTTQTYGAFRNQNTNNFLASTGLMGALDQLRKRLRSFHSDYRAGVGQTLVGDGTTDISFNTTSGKAWQLNLQTFPAITMLTEGAWINNDFNNTGWVTDLHDIQTDATGSSWGNNYFTFVMYMIQNSGTEPSHMVFNVPSGSYNTLSRAIADLKGHTNYNIDADLKGVAFLAYAFTFKATNTGGAWTLIDTEDLRGQTPSSIAGGGTSGTGVTELLQLLDVLETTYIGEGSNFLRVNAGETGVEFDAASTIDVGDFNDDGTYTTPSDLTNFFDKTVDDSDDIIEGSTNLFDEVVVLNYGGITTVTGTYPNFTIISTEVDGSITNELQNLGYSPTTGEVTISDGTNTTIGNFGTTNENYGFVKGSNGLGSTYSLRGDGSWDEVPSAVVGSFYGQIPFTNSSFDGLGYDNLYYNEFTTTLSVTGYGTIQSAIYKFNGGSSAAPSSPSFGELWVRTTDDHLIFTNAALGDIDLTSGGGTGTVTSVGITGTDFTISNSPITTSGNIAMAIASGVVGSTELAATAVTAGSYTSANITVDADGRLTSAANGTGSSVSFGTDGQVPYMNAAGDDLAYHTNFKYTLGALDIPSSGGTAGYGTLYVGSFVAPEVSSVSVTAGKGTYWAGDDGKPYYTNGVGTVIDLSAAGGGFADPMTTRGDMIFRNSSNTTARLPVGDVNFILGSDGTDVAWENKLVQSLTNGAKTASFTHDASSYSKGAYPLSTSSAVVVSIHNLESGMTGTITLDITTNPSAITVNGYSDAGTTAVTKVEMNTIANAANKRTIILYDCQNFGTYTDVTITYTQEQ